MDQRERSGDFQESFRAAVEGFLAQTWKIMPAIVQSVNFQQMTIVAQPTIRSLVRQENGTQVWTQLPHINDVPLVFFTAGPFAVTLPIAVNDEVLLLIADRCIDSWWQNGGIQNQFELRVHDLSDAFALPGPKSLPNVIPNISAQNLQIRTKDGSAYIEITPAGVINIVAPGGLNINGNTVITGTLEADELVTGDEGLKVTGAITATGEITAKGTHTVSEHVHGGVQSGGSDTEPPTG
jgi:phage baseplate assembly protein gpV